MPALHTAFRLVLESQRDGATSRGPDPGGEPGLDDRRRDTAAGTAPQPVRSHPDRSGHPVSR